MFTAVTVSFDHTRLEMHLGLRRLRAKERNALGVDA
jgi:hypothetical protein